MLVRVDLAGLDQLLDLGDRDPAGHGAQRVEVARRLVEHQVAVPVADRACTSAKSVVIASSSTYSRSPNVRVSFFGDASAIEPSAA